MKPLSLKDIGDISEYALSKREDQIWRDISHPVQFNKLRGTNTPSEKIEEYLFAMSRRHGYLCYIAELYNVHNIAEVGTAQGLQTFSFAEYLRQNNIDGHVWTCDIIDVKNRKYEQEYGDLVTFCIGDSQDMSKLLLSSEQKIDLFYIDGAHDRGDVIRDVYYLKEHQSESPIWIFDDYDTRFGCYDDIAEIINLSEDHRVYRVSHVSDKPNHQVIIHGKL
jgi:hypothetical protein